MKKITVFILVCMMVIGLCSSVYAYSEQVEPIPSVINNENTNFNDSKNWESNQTRTSDVPTETGTLPYSGSAYFAFYTYTNICFYPSSSGEVYTRFNGHIVNGSGNSSTCTVTMNLYKQGESMSVASFDLGTGSSWSNRVLRWYNLDPTKSYYFGISKTENNGLSMELDINKTNSF